MWRRFEERYGATERERGRRLDEAVKLRRSLQRRKVHDSGNGNTPAAVQGWIAEFRAADRKWKKTLVYYYEALLAEHADLVKEVAQLRLELTNIRQGGWRYRQW